MSIYAVFLTGLGLAMDAFAVAISNAMIPGAHRLRTALASAIAFGIAQGMMPIIGFYTGRTFTGKMQAVDHWVAVILLGVIGGKMILDAVQDMRSVEPVRQARTLGIKIILLQALATSIDALAVGISFSFWDIHIVGAALLIGGTTFVCCMIGAAIGNRVGSLFKEKAEIAGGLVLIGIGLNIFIQHVF